MGVSPCPNCGEEVGVLSERTVIGASLGQVEPTVITDSLETAPTYVGARPEPKTLIAQALSQVEPTVVTESIATRTVITDSLPTKPVVAEPLVNAAPTAIRDSLALVTEEQKTVSTDLPAVTAPGRPDPLLGVRLGDYVLQQEIGRGGMGVVYRAEQPLIGKTVAVKIVRGELLDTPEHMQRLLREARAVNAVHHRGIIDIFSFGSMPDGRQYLVMEYLKGVPLSQHIADAGKLPPQDALGLLEEIVDALAAAHAAGVVHRDLKPSNIFLVQQAGGGQYVKLLDFGMAKQGLSKGRSAPQTAVGLWAGTPQYMSPEQVRGDLVGPKTDLYALGVVAFEMVTGRLPFEAANQAKHMLAHVEEQPPAPADIEPSVPPEVSVFILKLLAKEPDERPSAADAREEIKHLKKVLAEPQTNPARPAGKPRHTPLPDAMRPAPLPKSVPELPKEPTTLPPDFEREIFQRPELKRLLIAAVVLGFVIGLLAWMWGW